MVLLRADAGAADAVPKKVMLTPGSFDLDLEAIDAAITAKTRMVIVNTPHNPTGRIYDAESLTALADLLERASARINRRIFLLSDEPYRRLRFDNRDFVSPAAIYPWTLHQLQLRQGAARAGPAARLSGGLAADAAARPRTAARGVISRRRWRLAGPSRMRIMQYAIPDLEDLSIDTAALARRRDTLMATLSTAGYDVLPPGRNLLPVQPLADRRRQRSVERARRPRRLRACPARSQRARPFPHQPDRVRRDGRTIAAGLPRGRSVRLTDRIGDRIDLAPGREDRLRRGDVEHRLVRREGHAGDIGLGHRDGGAELALRSTISRWPAPYSAM